MDPLLPYAWLIFCLTLAALGCAVFLLISCIKITRDSEQQCKQRDRCDLLSTLDRDGHGHCRYFSHEGRADK